MIKLPDEDPQVVTHYLSFTYSKCLPTDIFTTGFRSTFPEKSDEYYQLLAELYVLGERLLDETIRSTLITEIIRLAQLKDKDSQRHFPMKEAVNIIYHGTTAGSPARRLMVDIRVSHATTKWFDSTCEAVFVLDVTQNLYAKFDKHNFVSNFRDDTLKASDYLS